MKWEEEEEIKKERRRLIRKDLGNKEKRFEKVKGKWKK